MIELPIEPANTPAPSHLIDWTSRYACIVAACALRAKRAQDEPLVEEARLDALQRIEAGIIDGLVRGGTHPESAAFLAFAYVSRCVALATSAARA